MRQVICYLVITSLRNLDTVKWIDVSMPHKTSRRLKNHKQLEEIAKQNPDNKGIISLISSILRDPKNWKMSVSMTLWPTMSC